jgi:hypothetical protein
MPIDRHTRATLIRLSVDETLSLKFRLACRKELGDTVEFAGAASFVKPDAAG